MLITLPSVVWRDERYTRNPVRQLRESAQQLNGALTPLSSGRLQGFLFQPREGSNHTLVVPGKTPVPEHYSHAVKARVPDPKRDIDISDGTWIKHPLLDGTHCHPENEIRSVLESWTGAFSYIQEDLSQDVRGLRAPQIGAVHAIHAHWSVSDAPATIVMPTGTGKTETMLSLLVSRPCPRLLVVVPTHALRSQIAHKFLTLGILKEPNCSVLSPHAKYPIVGTLKHIPTTVADVDAFFGRCQVIVTTSSIAGQCSVNVQQRMAYYCPYLFIDEAHHAEAPTWRAFKGQFRGRRIVQFTATPFRQDGKPLDGAIVYKYPLKKAQQEGYFRPIHFRPVVEFNHKRSDAAIAEKAVEQLRADTDKGHILMARVGSVPRARVVFDIYKQYSEFNPVELHTGIKSIPEREAARNQILSGKSRIVVCVDMLGEGFDLPELKIAAFHDIRKTLAVTLQLVGRFTRSRPDLGDATFVANTADVEVQDELRKLYTRDPDWNVLLPELSERIIGEQVSLQNFLDGFTDFTNAIPLETVRPAVSTVVYKTKCANWNPDKFRAGIPAIDACGQVYSTTNENEHTLVVVAARRAPLAWTDVADLFSWQWELYVVIWSPEQDLLFINGSTNTGVYRALAEAVAGPNAALVRGLTVFRTFAGVNRLRLQNVGLTEQLGRNIRYTGRMGSDVESGLTDLQRQRARKSVLSGSGFEDGRRVTVGASRKGRIWSHQRTHVDKLAAWCKKVGAKLSNTQIDPDEVLKGTLDAKTVTRRPLKLPIAADWPEAMYKTRESIWSVVIDGQERPLSALDICLVDPAASGALKIALVSEVERIELALELFEENDRAKCRFTVLGGQTAKVRHGNTETNVTEFFYENPPTIWFADGSSLEGNEYVELKKSVSGYDAEKILAWDWTGVDIRKESQGTAKDQTSIQARVIRELKARDYVLVFDDDGAGEVADVVAIRLVGDSAAPKRIDVELYHCKYSQESVPGKRIADLYEVCGQAQKSVSWMLPEKRADLFTHLLRREAARSDRGTSSRYEVGDGDLLETIREMSYSYPAGFRVFIVQPGVSKRAVSPAQLLLMGVTENYLSETYQLPFHVIVSS